MNNNTKAGSLFLDSKCTHNLMRAMLYDIKAALTATLTAFFFLFCGYFLEIDKK